MPERFAQSVSVTDAIRKILNEYPCGDTIVFELVQNADDAGATEVDLVLHRGDPSAHANGQASEWSTFLTDAATPALFAANNSVFTDGDFDNIQHITGSQQHSKRSDATKVGRYGVGFNSVYHLADVAVFASRQYLVALDPSNQHIPERYGRCGGMRCDFTDAAERADPFVAALLGRLEASGTGFDRRRAYDGTLFYLPLRQAPTSFWRTTHTAAEVEALLADFARRALPSFGMLKNVAVIRAGAGRSAAHVDPTASSLAARHPREVIFSLSATRSNEGQSAQDRIKAWLRSYTETMRAVVARYEEDGGCQQAPDLSAEFSALPPPETLCYDVSLRCEGPMFAGAADSSSGDQTLTLTVAHRLGPETWVQAAPAFGEATCWSAACAAAARLSPISVPWAAVVVEDAAPCPGGGSLLCFFPVRQVARLPVHVHGFFQLSSDRQSVVVKSDWNPVLCRDVAPHAYAAAMERLTLKGAATYALWPCGEFDDEITRRLAGSTLAVLADAPLLHTTPASARAFCFSPSTLGRATGGRDVFFDEDEDVHRTLLACSAAGTRCLTTAVSFEAEFAHLRAIITRLHETGHGVTVADPKHYRALLEGYPTARFGIVSPLQVPLGTTDPASRVCLAARRTARRLLRRCGNHAHGLGAPIVPLCPSPTATCPMGGEVLRPTTAAVARIAAAHRELLPHLLECDHTVALLPDGLLSPQELDDVASVQATPGIAAELGPAELAAQLAGLWAAGGLSWTETAGQWSLSVSQVADPVIPGDAVLAFLRDIAPTTSLPVVPVHGEALDAIPGAPLSKDIVAASAACPVVAAALAVLLKHFNVRRMHDAAADAVLPAAWRAQATVISMESPGIVDVLDAGLMTMVSSADRAPLLQLVTAVFQAGRLDGGHVRAAGRLPLFTTMWGTLVSVTAGSTYYVPRLADGDKRAALLEDAAGRIREGVLSAQRAMPRGTQLLAQPSADLEALLVAAGAQPCSILDVLLVACATLPPAPAEEPLFQATLRELAAPPSLRTQITQHGLALLADMQLPVLAGDATALCPLRQCLAPAEFPDADPSVITETFRTVGRARASGGVTESGLLLDVGGVGFGDGAADGKVAVAALTTVRGTTGWAFGKMQVTAFLKLASLSLGALPQDQQCQLTTGVLSVLEEALHRGVEIHHDADDCPILIFAPGKGKTFLGTPQHVRHRAAAKLAPLDDVYELPEGVDEAAYPRCAKAFDWARLPSREDMVKFLRSTNAFPVLKAGALTAEAAAAAVPDADLRAYHCDAAVAAMKRLEDEGPGFGFGSPLAGTPLFIAECGGAVPVGLVALDQRGLSLEPYATSPRRAFINTHPRLLQGWVMPRHSTDTIAAAINFMTQQTPLALATVGRCAQALLYLLDVGGAAEMRERAATLRVPTSDMGARVASEAAFVYNPDETRDVPDSRTLHRHIAPDVARALGVPSVGARLVREMRSNTALPGFRARGQTQSLDKTIKAVLKDYSDSQSVLLEMLQNADDAKATKVVFTLDERTWHTAEDRLVGSGMKKCQGPALCVFNDSQFTRTDLDALLEIRSGHKQGNAGAIGRFGIGFNAVFHMTDCPALLSGPWLAFLDPLCAHVADATHTDPGAVLEYTTEGCNLTEALRDQVEPLVEHAPGFDDAEPYGRTLFRLPLRTKEAVSSGKVLKREAWSCEKVRDLFREFADRTLPHVLLFLNNITEVELRVVGADNNVVPVACCRVADDAAAAMSTHRAVVRQHTAEATPLFTEQDVVLETTTKDGTVVPRCWHLAAHVGDAGSDAAKAATDRVDADLRDKMRPVVGCAFEVDPETKIALSERREGGRVNCFLPLPAPTGTGLHVHGCFTIPSDRRGVRLDAHDSDSWEVAWNRYLLQLLSECTARAFATAARNVMAVSPPAAGTLATTPDAVQALYDLWPNPALAGFGKELAGAFFDVLLYSDTAHSVAWSANAGGFVALPSPFDRDGDDVVASSVVGLVGGGDTDAGLPVDVLDVLFAADAACPVVALPAAWVTDLDTAWAAAFDDGDGEQNMPCPGAADVTTRMCLPDDTQTAALRDVLPSLASHSFDDARSIIAELARFVCAADEASVAALPAVWLADTADTVGDVRLGRVEPLPGVDKYLLPGTVPVAQRLFPAVLESGLVIDAAFFGALSASFKKHVEANARDATVDFVLELVGKHAPDMVSAPSSTVLGRAVPWDPSGADRVRAQWLQAFWTHLGGGVREGPAAEAPELEIPREWHVVPVSGWTDEPCLLRWADHGLVTSVRCPRSEDDHVLHRVLGLYTRDHSVPACLPPPKDDEQLASALDDLGRFDPALSALSPAEKDLVFSVCYTNLPQRGPPVLRNAMTRQPLTKQHALMEDATMGIEYVVLWNRGPVHHGKAAPYHGLGNTPLDDGYLVEPVPKLNQASDRVPIATWLRDGYQKLLSGNSAFRFSDVFTLEKETELLRWVHKKCTNSTGFGFGSFGGSTLKPEALADWSFVPTLRDGATLNRDHGRVPAAQCVLAKSAIARALALVKGSLGAEHGALPHLIPLEFSQACPELFSVLGVKGPTDEQLCTVAKGLAALWQRSDDELQATLDRVLGREEVEESVEDVPITRTAALPLTTHPARLRLHAVTRGFLATLCMRPSGASAGLRAIPCLAGVAPAALCPRPPRNAPPRGTSAGTVVPWVDQSHRREVAVTMKLWALDHCDDAAGVVGCWTQRGIAAFPEGSAVHPFGQKRAAPVEPGTVLDHILVLGGSKLDSSALSGFLDEAYGTLKKFPSQQRQGALIGRCDDRVLALARPPGDPVVLCSRAKIATAAGTGRHCAPAFYSPEDLVPAARDLLGSRVPLLPGSLLSAVHAVHEAAKLWGDDPSAGQGPLHAHLQLLCTAAADDFNLAGPLLQCLSGKHADGLRSSSLPEQDIGAIRGALPQLPLPTTLGATAPAARALAPDNHALLNRLRGSTGDPDAVMRRLCVTSLPPYLCRALGVASMAKFLRATVVGSPTPLPKAGQPLPDEDPALGTALVAWGAFFRSVACRHALVRLIDAAAADQIARGDIAPAGTGKSRLDRATAGGDLPPLAFVRTLRTAVVDTRHRDEAVLAEATAPFSVRGPCGSHRRILVAVAEAKGGEEHLLGARRIARAITAAVDELLGGFLGDRSALLLVLLDVAARSDEWADIADEEEEEEEEEEGEDEGEDEEEEDADSLDTEEEEGDSEPYLRGAYSTQRPKEPIEHEDTQGVEVDGDARPLHMDDAVSIGSDDPELYDAVMALLDELDCPPLSLR